MEIKGKYGTGYIYANAVEQEAISQVIMLLNQKAFEGSKVRIMPDVHVGVGCVIGFTGRFAGNRVIPNIVGVDIGCGMLTKKIGKIDFELKDFDEFVKSVIPMGMKRNNNVGQKRQTKDFLEKYIEIEKIENVCTRIGADFSDVLNSLGTLGGGNHFIEIDEDGITGEKYLIIHSGSRNFGKRVAEWHQKKAQKLLEEKRKELKSQFDRDLESAKQKNEEYKIEKLQEEYERKMELISVPSQLSYLEGVDAELYISDMQTAQKYAYTNRELMCRNILEFFAKTEEIKQILENEKFQTIHNYLSEKDGIIRKGAIAANFNEKVLIPINMRDGCIIGIGKGNAEWNNSAPHGAGRLMSRSEAKAKLSLEKFRKEMKDVYSSTVNQGTLDESPMAYKPMKEILDAVGETVDVAAIIKPIYNVKAVEEEHGRRIKNTHLNCNDIKVLKLITD